MDPAVDEAKSQNAPEVDEMNGEIYDGEIRYLLMRPDVLMGLLKNLPADSRSIALQAFAQSAFENGMASMLHYEASGLAGTDDALDYLCRKGAALGWGRWNHSTDDLGNPVFAVINSPFAAGYGSCNQPVCAPIAGIIRAMIKVCFGRDCSVAETQCAAQGAESCRFQVTFSS
jgi:uncharacterized protein